MAGLWQIVGFVELRSLKLIEIIKSRLRQLKSFTLDDWFDWFRLQQTCEQQLELNWKEFMGDFWAFIVTWRTKNKNLLFNESRKWLKISENDLFFMTLKVVEEVSLFCPVNHAVSQDMNSNNFIKVWKEFATGLNSIS